MEEVLALNHEKVTLWDYTGTVTGVRIGSDVEGDARGNQYGGYSTSTTDKRTRFSVRGEDGVEENYWFPGDEASLRTGNRVSVLCGKVTESFLFWSKEKKGWMYLVNHDSREQWCFWKKPKDFVFSIGIVNQIPWWRYIGQPLAFGIFALIHIELVENSSLLETHGSSGMAFGIWLIIGLFFVVGEKITKEVKARSIWTEQLKLRFERMAAEVLVGNPGLTKRGVGAEAVVEDFPVGTRTGAGKTRMGEKGLADGLPVKTGRYEEKEPVGEDFPVSTRSNEGEALDLEVTPDKKMCLECGGVNRAGATFCGQCGIPI